MTHKAGIKNVAQIAGVSTATVSRTLRNPELVSQNTKDKVIKAINACNYQPNQMGINLRTQRSGNIVAIIPDITNPFNSGLIKSIEFEAKKHGYSVLLGDTQGDEDKIKHYASMVNSRQADGIILCSHFMPFDKKYFNTLPPLVNVNENSYCENVHKVMIDNVGGATIAVEHLLNLKHKRIGIISGPIDVSSSMERLEGYKLALKYAGIAFDEELVQIGNYQIESGIVAAKKLLLLKKRPSAIFCFNDEMAIGAISALKDNGVDVPKDMSIIGFDDIRFAKFLSPSLTTIQQPVEHIGQASVDMLVKLINNKKLDNKYIELPVKLIIRNSTGFCKI